MASFTTELAVKDAVEECTPSRVEVIASEFLNGTIKGGVTGAITGVVVGSETGPGAILTGAIGSLVGAVSGAVVGVVGGALTHIEPNGACMAKQLLSENVTPLDTPGNPQKSAAPKRTV